MSRSEPNGIEHSDPHERAQTRWRSTGPILGLTWGKEISGYAFVTKAASYGAFGPDKSVLEIGPGYGRLLRACLEQKQPFQTYTAVDISQQNVKFLTEQFGSEKVTVIHGDAESVSLNGGFDSVLSSLTLKHLYPSFLIALRNIRQYLNPGAIVIFDLLEGNYQEFSPDDDVTFLRLYSQDEVTEILKSVPLELVAFDQVRHTSDQQRLLVVARNEA